MEFQNESNQVERRIYLIERLLNERKNESDGKALIAYYNIERKKKDWLKNEEAQKRILRALFNTRMPDKIDVEFLSVQDEYLQEETRKKGFVELKDMEKLEKGIYIWRGDITRIKADAIVNAANSQMLGCFIPNHKCIDNAIHTFAGVQLRIYCNEMMKNQGHEEETGKAKITPGFNLPARNIIHTVGPIVYGELTKRECELLKSCYKSCLELAVGKGLKSIAFCCISTGEFRFPNEKAAEIAVETVRERYGFEDMYSGGFYPFESDEIYWAYWSRYININRYEDVDNGTYKNLYELVKDKNYFVITTNVDHMFQKAGFDKSRLFYTQGDYGLFQCSVPCCQKTFDNEDIVKKMVEQQKDMKIPSELVPIFPNCGAKMTMNLRADDKFVEDEGWHKAKDRYVKFLENNLDKKILFLELGVGLNTPGIIKYPFWRMVKNGENAKYISISLDSTYIPEKIADRSMCINDDIGKVLTDIKK